MTGKKLVETVEPPPSLVDGVFELETGVFELELELEIGSCVFVLEADGGAGDVLEGILDVDGVVFHCSCGRRARISVRGAVDILDCVAFVFVVVVRAQRAGYREEQNCGPSNQG